MRCRAPGDARPALPALSLLQTSALRAPGHDRDRAQRRGGQFSTAPCTVQVPRGPTRSGPRRCRREPSLAQQPVASQLVTTAGGRGSTGGAAGAGKLARAAGPGAGGDTLIGARSVARGACGAGAAPRQARLAARRSGSRRARACGDLDAPGDGADSASWACSASRARRQSAERGASSARAAGRPTAASAISHTIRQAGRCHEAQDDMSPWSPPQAASSRAARTGVNARAGVRHAGAPGSASC